MTLSIVQTNAAILTFTGTLVANTVIMLPPMSGRWVVSNQTVGGFSLSLQAKAMVPVVVAAASQSTHLYYTDGQNVFDASQSTTAIAGAIAAYVQAYLPAGAIQEFAMNTPPVGWLACDGSAVSRSGNFGLFTAIGVIWGAGDGVTTFNLPDFRGTFRRAWDNGKGIDPGRVFGSYQADNFASHTHLQNSHAHGVTDPGHSHNYTSNSQTFNAASGTNGVSEPLFSQATGTVATGVSINAGTAVNQATGGTETTVKNFATLVCIRT